MQYILHDLLSLPLQERIDIIEKAISDKPEADIQPISALELETSNQRTNYISNC